MPLAPGQIINNRYRVVHLLGHGGFGSLYRVWDINLERPRALKENLDASIEVARQFKREAQILCDLNHPNLPKAIDHFIIPGQGQYLVMEYVDGEDLVALMDRSGGRLETAQAISWIVQVCDALSYLHSQNPPIIHRDIKPANIRVTPAGKAVLVDFGIAKTADPGAKTMRGAKAVTSGYSPPEQYGVGFTDAQSDIYALGATLYHLLTGQQPADSLSIFMHNLPPVESASAINPAVPASISQVIAKAMQLDRADRWLAAEEFKAALITPPEVFDRPTVAPLSQRQTSLSAEAPVEAVVPKIERPKKEKTPKAARSFAPRAYRILATRAPAIIAGVTAVAILALIIYFLVSQPPRPVTETRLPPSVTMTATLPEAPLIGPVAQVLQVKGALNYEMDRKANTLTSAGSLPLGRETRAWIGSGQATIKLKDGSIIILGPETTIYLTAGSGSAIQIERGRLLALSGGLQVSPRTGGYQAWAADGALVGVTFDSTIDRFWVDCFGDKGECNLMGRDGYQQFGPGQAMGYDNGQVSRLQGANYTAWRELSTLVPEQTATPAATGTVTPTPTKTPVKISPTPPATEKSPPEPPEKPPAKPPGP